ncbi:molybdopterin synthase sulfur carrier subunit [Aplochiton taeniatus]
MTTEVTVLYFAKSAELTGVKSETVRVPSSLTSFELWGSLVQAHPKLSEILGQVVLAVRQEYVTLGDQCVSLQNGDEVAVIPPLSGG